MDEAESKIDISIKKLPKMLQALRIKISLTPYYSSSLGFAILLYESLWQRNYLKLIDFFCKLIDKTCKNFEKIIFSLFPSPSSSENDAPRGRQDSIRWIFAFFTRSVRDIGFHASDRA